jgi:hypothetical protein
MHIPFEVCGAKMFRAEAAILLFIQTCPCSYSTSIDLAMSILASCKSFVGLKASLMAQGFLSPLDVCLPPELPVPEKASSGRKPTYSLFKIASTKVESQTSPWDSNQAITHQKYSCYKTERIGGCNAETQDICRC